MYRLILIASAFFSTSLMASHHESVEEVGLTFENKLAACSACHGVNGDQPLAPDYPVLSGQYQDYLESALMAYKTGRRQHMIMNMQVQALALTDADISKLAAYFASKPGLIGLGE
jgi:cytochrome c553